MTLVNLLHEIEPVPIILYYFTILHFYYLLKLLLCHLEIQKLYDSQSDICRSILNILCHFTAFLYRKSLDLFLYNSVPCKYYCIQFNNIFRVYTYSKVDSNQWKQFIHE